MAYWPLAAGLLSGKYRRGVPMPAESRFATRKKWLPRVAEWHTEQNYDALDRLVPWARDHGHSIIELAFAWLLAHPAVGTMIAGASSPEQLRSNVEAITWRLTPDEFVEVTALARSSSTPISSER
jgi:aryl-alcohol dehydrogenase-like predicted oxidoreductase